MSRKRQGPADAGLQGQLPRLVLVCAAGTRTSSGLHRPQHLGIPHPAFAESSRILCGVPVTRSARPHSWLRVDPMRPRSQSPTPGAQGRSRSLRTWCNRRILSTQVIRAGSSHRYHGSLAEVQTHICTLCDTRLAIGQSATPSRSCVGHLPRTRSATPRNCHIIYWRGRVMSAFDP